MIVREFRTAEKSVSETRDFPIFLDLATLTEGGFGIWIKRSIESRTFSHRIHLPRKN